MVRSQIVKKLAYYMRYSHLLAKIWGLFMATTITSFDDIMVNLSHLGVNEDHYQWLGFIEGVIARGCEIGSPTLSKAVADILNGGMPLPGAFTAFITNLALELRTKLASSADDPFFYPKKTAKNSVKLKTLADLATGLNLGLAVNAQGIVEHEIHDDNLKDFMNTLGSISQVDTSDDMDEEDLKAVLDYLATELRRIYRQNNK